MGLITVGSLGSSNPTVQLTGVSYALYPAALVNVEYGD